MTDEANQGGELLQATGTYCPKPLVGLTARVTLGLTDAELDHTTLEIRRRQRVTRAEYFIGQTGTIVDQNDDQAYVQFIDGRIAEIWLPYLTILPTAEVPAESPTAPVKSS